MADERLWAPWRLEYIKGPKPDGCILCDKPAEGDDEATYVVHRGEHCFVILNAFPYNNGHVMIAPYEHAGALEDLDGRHGARADAAHAARDPGARATSTGPEGFNIGINQGKVAGRRGRGPHPPARRAALGRRHELHAGDRLDARAAAEPGRLLPRPARALLRLPRMVDPSIFKAYDVRGLYGEQIDEDVAYRRRPRLRARPRRPRGQARRPSCGSGSGATCAWPRRRCPSATRTASATRARTCSTSGQVGTEMLYFTVGSRGLDGGLMCTASHNPKAYTGAKLVRRGAIALSGDAGIGELSEIVTGGEPGDPRRAARRATSARTSPRASRPRPRPSSTSTRSGR